MVKNLPAVQEMWVQSLGQEDPPGETGNSCLHSCQENLVDRGAWWATVLVVAKCWTWLSDWASTRARQHVDMFWFINLEALWTMSFWVFLVGFPGSAWVFIKTSLNTRRDWLNYWPLRAMKFQPSKSHGRPSSLSCLCALQKSVH